MAYIDVDHVSKTYRIVRHEPGVLASMKSLFHRKYTLKEAVHDISFQIERGEIVGYIGPNGAGKSTTIKMLSGVLTPDAGKILVGDIEPYLKRKENARHIGVVFGQRSQLYWDLPIADTFELYRKLYEIPKDLYERNKAFYIDALDMGSFVGQPARQLSLGQKMKANLALALLHDPKVVYLDEPTIGLDVMSKRTLRESIKLLNREKNTTILLTTHDMNDIEAVCDRLILIDKGEKLFDGSQRVFREQYVDGFTITMTCQTLPIWQEDARFDPPVINEKERTFVIATRGSLTTKEALMALIDRYDPENISVKEQQIEDVIARLFRTGMGLD